DPRRHQSIGAWRRVSMMAAGLEADVSGRVFGRGAGTVERFALRVRAPAALGPAASDHAALARQDAANRGIWPAVSERALGQSQRRRHMRVVGRKHGHRLIHTPQRYSSGVTGSDKVSTKFSKSLTSRKFL